MKLAEIQDRWIEHFSVMEQNPNVTSSKLAAPFLSAEQADYDPVKHKTILYIGKATAGLWYRPEFQASRTRAERRAKTLLFLEEVTQGKYTSAFWNFARMVSAAAGADTEHSFAQFVWSNVAKIGVVKGNPPRSYLDPQSDLAKDTLIAEIEFYRPSLIVFVSGDYGEQIVRSVLRHFDADQDDTSWQKSPDFWSRKASDRLPATLCVNHPERKAKATLSLWAKIAQDLIQ